MLDFTSSYFTMKESDVVEYVKTMLDCFKEDADLSCKEIGDGNLNYVFRVVDHKTGQSIILKQAGPVARISDEFKVSTDRNRIEYEILRIQYDLAPGLVPKVYHYDAVMNCCVMEDLSDHRIMRTALMNYEKFPLFADHITTFMVNTLLLTSDVVMNHKEKKALVGSFINPDLCEITEDLVYTEPFFDCPRNDVFPPTIEFARNELWKDEKLRLETAKLKFEFMTHAQSLIHGDLHTGSIFVKPESTKVIDPEFAFYGPAGYDVGNVLANLIFSYLHADATIEDLEQKEDYKDWLAKTIIDVTDLFRDKFMTTWKEKIKEPVARYKGFPEYYLDGVMRDTSAAAGLELCRRTLGIAHVRDITSICDVTKRARAEKIALTIGKRFILERENIAVGTDYVRVLKETEEIF